MRKPYLGTTARLGSDEQILISGLNGYSTLLRSQKNQLIRMGSADLLPRIAGIDEMLERVARLREALETSRVRLNKS